MTTACRCTLEIPAWYPLFLVAYVAATVLLLEIGIRVQDWWNGR